MTRMTDKELKDEMASCEGYFEYREYHEVLTELLEARQKLRVAEEALEVISKASWHNIDPAFNRADEALSILRGEGEA